MCGRRIFWDHTFSDRNLQAHLLACPRQMAKVARIQKSLARKERRRLEKNVARARQLGVGSTVLPAAGQLGMPFLGVPDEVTGVDDDED
jgi:hypothetical protein